MWQCHCLYSTCSKALLHEQCHPARATHGPMHPDIPSPFLLFHQVSDLVSISVRMNIKENQKILLLRWEILFIRCGNRCPRAMSQNTVEGWWGDSKLFWTENRKKRKQDTRDDKVVVSCPTRWSLYWPLALCIDHLPSLSLLSTERRGTAMY